MLHWVRLIYWRLCYSAISRWPSNTLSVYLLTNHMTQCNIVVTLWHWTLILQLLLTLSLDGELSWYISQDVCYLNLIVRQLVGILQNLNDGTIIIMLYRSSLLLWFIWGQILWRRLAPRRNKGKKNNSKILVWTLPAYYLLC